MCEGDALVARTACRSVGVELGAALHAARLDHQIERILDAERCAARVLAQVEADAQVVEADAGAGEAVRVQGLGEACDHIGLGAPSHPFHISGGRRFGDRAATRPGVGLTRHLAEGQQFEDADLIRAVGLAVLFHDREQGEIGFGDREDHRDGRVAGDDRGRQRFLQVPTLEDGGVARGVGDIVLVGQDDRVQSGRGKACPDPLDAEIAHDPLPPVSFATLLDKKNSQYGFLRHYRDAVRLVKAEGASCC